MYKPTKLEILIAVVAMVGIISFVSDFTSNPYYKCYHLVIKNGQWEANEPFLPGVDAQLLMPSNSGITATWYYCDRFNDQNTYYKCAASMSRCTNQTYNTSELRYMLSKAVNTINTRVNTTSYP